MIEPIPLKKTKVVLINSNRWNSAITEYALSFAYCIKRLDLELMVISLSNSPFDIRLRKDGFFTRSLSGFGFNQLLCLSRIFNDWKPNAVVTFGGPECFLTGLCRLRCSFKHFRFIGYHKKSPEYRPLKLKFLGVDHLLFPSQGLIRQHLPLSIASIKADFLRIGTSEKRFFYKPVYSSSCSQHPFLLIFGRFDPVKGHREFLKLFDRFTELFFDLNIRLKIVGQPANTSVKMLKELVGQGKLIQDRVEIIDDRIEDVQSLLQSALCGVVPSVGSEIICRVAQEFLLCGTPVFVNNVGSLSEVVVESLFGGVFDLSRPQDANCIQLKQLVEEELRSGLKRKEKRANSAKKIFSLDKMKEDLINIMS